jgi:hypothetical protein
MNEERDNNAMNGNGNGNGNGNSNSNGNDIMATVVGAPSSMNL